MDDMYDIDGTDDTNNMFDKEGIDTMDKTWYMRHLKETRIVFAVTFVALLVVWLVGLPELIYFAVKAKTDVLLWVCAVDVTLVIMVAILSVFYFLMRVSDKIKHQKIESSNENNIDAAKTTKHANTSKDELNTFYSPY